MKKHKILRTARIVVFVLWLVCLIGSFFVKTDGFGFAVIITGCVLFFVLIYLCSEIKKCNAVYPISGNKKKYKGKLKHIDGLPIPQDVIVDVYYCPDSFTITKDKTNYVIQMSKITGMDCVAKKDVGATLSNMAGCALLLGGTGALMGAMSDTYCLVVTYLSDDRTKYIILEDNSVLLSTKIARDYKSRHKNDEAKTVEL